MTTALAEPKLRTPDRIQTAERRLRRVVIGGRGNGLPADLVEVERLFHDDVKPRETSQAGVRGARVEDPLDRYLARGELHRTLYNLAREYGLLRWRAGLVPNARANPMMDRVDGSSSAEHPIEGKTDALSRLVKTDALVLRLSGQRKAGRRHLSVLAAVCAEGHSASAWAASRGHSRSGRELGMLRDALRILGRVWGRR